MATFLAHITIRPDRERDFEHIVAALHQGTHEREPGVRRYEYWRGAAPRSYYAHASFDDVRAFIEHEASDHHEIALPQLREVIESIRIEWVDPVGGASALGATGDGDAVDVQPWWLPLRQR
jgi:quinol monooxygenase YgiN